MKKELEAILTRRSIRRYTGEPVPEAMIRNLLDAGFSAPSAGDERPWHFVVVTDRQKLIQLAGVSPYAGMLKEAALGIIVVGDQKLQKYEGYWVQDCSAATENILIAANALGLGAVWLGIHPIEEREKRIREWFKMPDDVTPFCVISIGHKGEEKPPAQRYDQQRVHRNQW